jgi:hypothetical protein
LKKLKNKLILEHILAKHCDIHLAVTQDFQEIRHLNNDTMGKQHIIEVPAGA